MSNYIFYTIFCRYIKKEVPLLTSIQKHLFFHKKSQSYRKNIFLYHAKSSNLILGYVFLFIWLYSYAIISSSTYMIILQKHFSFLYNVKH